MGKNKRYGQAAKISDKQMLDLRRAIKFPKHRLIIDIARYTGERMGALVQLKVSDVYADPAKSIPLEMITYRKRTRKASPDGSCQTRQVPVHPELAESLRNYSPPLDGYLFPGKEPGTHLTFDMADKFLNQAIVRAGLEHVGISTHSFRVTAITKLVQSGADLSAVQAFTGHHSVAMVGRYVASDADRLKAVVGLL